MPHYKYLHRSTLLRDAFWLVMINVIFLFIFAHYDVLELMFEFSREYEDWELDELLPLSATLTISLVIFLYRRMKELGEITYAFEQLSKLDPLTQVLNRRAGQAQLANYVQRAEQSKQGFALVQLNIDNFKHINDLYGSSIGDEVLIKLVELLRKVLPKASQLIRWHGDTFLIILPSQQGAIFQLAHDIHSKVNTELLASLEKTTCSLGVAVWQPGMNSEHILHAVEDALFDAKNQGKNKLVFA